MESRKSVDLDRETRNAECLKAFSAKEREQSAIETERFFAERRARADDAAFLRILNREGGEPPRPEDSID